MKALLEGVPFEGTTREHKGLLSRLTGALGNAVATAAVIFED